MDIKKAHMMATDLIRYYCPDYRFVFTSAKRTFGRCNYVTRTIGLSKGLATLNNEDQVLDTLLHEVAHAIAGAEARHGEQWKQTARSLGCAAKALYDSKVVVAVPRPFIGVCPGCQKQVTRYRRKRISCSKCGEGKFNPAYLFVWSKQGE